MVGLCRRLGRDKAANYVLIVLRLGHHVRIVRDWCRVLVERVRFRDELPLWELGLKFLYHVVL